MARRPNVRIHKLDQSAPRCAFCGRSEGVQFNIFAPRFRPFGTACVECEAKVPEGTVPPVAEKVGGAL